MINPAEYPEIEKCLNPCPFCGNDKIVVTMVDTIKVECNKCGANKEINSPDNPALIIAEWNYRKKEEFVAVTRKDNGKGETEIVTSVKEIKNLIDKGYKLFIILDVNELQQIVAKFHDQ